MVYIFKPQNLRHKCIVCGVNKPNTKEHVYPKWMLKLTNTLGNKINWVSGKKEVGSSCVFPICEECNKSLNENIEKPFQSVFKKLREGRKITDTEVEIVIKWMWKVTQMFWLYEQNKGDIAWNFSLKEKLLNSIENPRYRISIALGRTTKNIKKNKMEPLGLDILAEYDTILAAGVFSNISIIVFRTEYSYLIPDKYFVYTLQKIPKNKIKNGYAFAKDSFIDSGEAINTTIKTAEKLLPLHEKDALLCWQVLENI